MAILKCKMCGGDIELAADKTFGTCEFCGCSMTFPKVDDDQRAAAFNRGNHFRRIGEFDKALAVYERIVREDDTDAEAHWCCALCRFGIEYVEDPATYEWLPTCHRASFDSFLEDVDYKAAVEYSDGITRRQYQKDGAKIAEVQRGILATSQNTEPYDVFICYKESDEQGNRTRDSLMAQDIYYQLTEQGRKVFFSRITLEDVAGTQYEPYIFAALNSAKVMVVVGTKPEYLNAVWVKNEWSRFLAMMKKDRSKLLLPCYKDMDPYDLPEQLSVLQSYDMGKIGFIQDLSRGIAKVLNAEKKAEPAKETVVVQQTANSNIAALLKRGSLALEDGEWTKADGFYEEVLNQNAECAEAYLGKFLAAQNCCTITEYFASLAEETVDVSSETFIAYPEAIAHIDAAVARYTVDSYLTADTIQNLYAFDRSYTSTTPNRIRQKEAQLKELNAERLLLRARQYAQGALKETLEQSVGEFSRILDDRIRQAQMQDQESIDRITAACRAHMAQADVKAQELHKKMLQKRERDYQHHLQSMANATSIHDYDRICDALLAMNSYKDTAELATKCRAESDRLAAEEQTRQLRLQEEENRRAKAAAAKKRRTALIALAAAALCAVICFVTVKFVIPEMKYNQAVKLCDAGEYVQALDIFIDMEQQKDTLDMQKKALNALKVDYKRQADEALSVGNNIRAAVLYTKAGESGRAKRAFDFSTRLIADLGTSVGIMADGTLRIQQNYETYVEKTLHDYASICEFTDFDLEIVGIDRDGKITGDMYSEETFEAFQSWSNIEQFHTRNISGAKNAALLKNGTVKVYDFATHEEVPVSWENIVEVGVCGDNVWGLDSAGTVHYLSLEDSEVKYSYDLREFTSIEKVEIGGDYAIGLKDTSELVYAENRSTYYGAVYPFPLYRLTGITDFTTASGWIITVHEDGTVTGKSEESRDPDPGYDYSAYYSAVEDELRKWRGIITVLPCGSGVVGITYDGSLVYQSLSYKEVDEGHNKRVVRDHPELEAQLESWEDIVYLDSANYRYVEYEDKYAYHVLGLHSDGAVCSLGTGEYTESKKGVNKYYFIIRSGGTFDDVSTWKLWE